MRSFLSGILGGLVVLAAGGALLLTDVIEIAPEERSAPTAQQPLAPVADSGSDAEGGGEGEGEGGGEANTVNEIYDRTSAGVVFIEARVPAERSPTPFGLPQPEGEATGSGFVIDGDGYILTNAHVVRDASEVRVRFGAETEDLVDAEIVGTDISTDLALLRVDPSDQELRPVPLGDSAQVDVGDPVVAIGNPFGFDRTVTTGIVSALQRQITAPNRFPIQDVIQTDAAINPGNSGGPLLDGAGRVIGINSQIATGGSGSGGSVGIGFAVPINTAKIVVPQLRQTGRVRRAYLGVTTASVSAEQARALDLPTDDGALVQELADGGPAQRAGLRGPSGLGAAGQLRPGGDLIVAVDGRPVRESADISRAIADNRPGDEITVEFLRGGRRQRAQVRLAERPEDPADQGSGGGLIPRLP